MLDNNTMIIINGDERTLHGQIVQIMDIARQVGLVDQATSPKARLSQVRTTITLPRRIWSWTTAI